MHKLGTTSADIAQASQILRRGGLVAFPTETVYGLGADASNERALAAIFRAKGRPPDHPVIVHVPDAASIERWASDIPDAAWAVAQAFWPGPLTLILKRAPHVSDWVTGGQDTIGLRVPDHPVAQALLREFGGGIAAPSANRFGRVSPTLASHVEAEMSDVVDALIDGGATRVGIESTILDLSTPQWRVLRPGAITATDVNRVLGNALAHASAATAAPRVSGSLTTHYAPTTALQLGDPLRWDAQVHELCSASQASAVMSFKAPPSHLPNHCRWIRMPDRPGAYAHELYARLHDLDRWGCAAALVEPPPATIEWEAVRDRLRRATHTR